MFTVRWAQSALNELAALWTQGDSAYRQALNALANQIDHDLRRNPNAVGESRDGPERVWFLFPLGVRFEVDDQRAVVRVLHVWSYRRRG